MLKPLSSMIIFQRSSIISLGTAVFVPRNFTCDMIARVTGDHIAAAFADS